MSKLSSIQAALKAPKGQFNNFGKYYYRSAEDIVEAVKPILNTVGFHLILTDHVCEVGNRIYVKATATISDGTETYTATAWAREDEIKKGMDGAQITGAASSYARKYALNGLFAIDDTKDADALKQEDELTDSQRNYLLSLVETSNYDVSTREKLQIRIKGLTTLVEFNKAKANLESNQSGIDGTVNPSQKQISAHVKKIAK